MTDNTKNFNRIWTLIQAEYPDAAPELHFSNTLQILVATILSAQCTDAQVNRVTDVLFKKYRSVEDFANADISDLEKDIYSTGFYRNKAKNIKKSAQIIISNFNSQVPNTMEDILTLPGVARKTANIVLARGHGVVEGIAVDTHVKRLSNLLGFTENNDPVKIEKDLMNLARKEDWEALSMTLILHGRRVCVARKPKCGVCVVSELCPSRYDNEQ
ncbi:MAG: endonuclease III [Methanosarcinaceae archaeon]|nr:endonuclease III [Methanosarcinaceae archaeon]MDF1533375.1 endonuclease III [Methanosarcinaceae archaeon]